MRGITPDGTFEVTADTDPPVGGASLRLLSAKQTSHADENASGSAARMSVSTSWDILLTVAFQWGVPGCAWKVMEGHGRSWKVTEGHGRSRKVTEGHGRSRNSRKVTESHGNSRKVTEGHGRSRKVMEGRGSKGVCLGAREASSMRGR